MVDFEGGIGSSEGAFCHSAGQSGIGKIEESGFSEVLPVLTLALDEIAGNPFKERSESEIGELFLIVSAFGAVFGDCDEAVESAGLVEV